ncbi:MAG: acetylornithine deacetylase/succinyl-diaminopimelate desuccinylase-like protein [Myxococcota bacterium]|jgi:acetylornithine deacetylase/succinyl-diaminopimelate desuccinylase-like protein
MRSMASVTPPPIPFDTPESLLDDGQRLFRELLQIDTTNPPGNEVVAADQCVAWLAEEGISSRTFDAAPGRRSLVAAIGPEGDDALVISAHLDVVPADPEHWDHPPFEAVEADGCIWGRGAIDMKNGAAFGLAIMRQLARTKAPLKRGVKLVLVADEEAGCEYGSLALARAHPDWMRGAVAVTEVGGFTTHVEQHRVYPVQVAEKGFVWMRLTIKGVPGHGSMPHMDNAVIKLAELVQHIAKQPFPFRCTVPVRDFLDGIGDVLGGVKGGVFRGIGSEILSNFVLDRLVADESRTRVFRALLKDTISPTMVQAGTKANVIPGQASLTVDCRILPGTDPDAFVEEFKRRVPGDYDVEVIQKGPPLVFDKNHPIVGQMFDVLRAADPGCVPVPQMITGFTDARAFAEIGMPCYGFLPIWLPPDINFAAMFHGHNERIPIHGFRWGLACMNELVRRFCM